MGRHHSWERLSSVISWATVRQKFVGEQLTSYRIGVPARKSIEIMWVLFQNHFSVLGSQGANCRCIYGSVCRGVLVASFFFEQIPCSDTFLSICVCL